MQAQDKISIPVNEAVELSGICRSRLYELISASAIKSYVLGKRRLIDVDDLRRFIKALPSSR